MLIGDRSLTAEEAVRCFKDKHRPPCPHGNYMYASMRDHYVHPPPRVIDGILVFDGRCRGAHTPPLLYHDRLKCPGTASGLHDDDVIDDELINRAIERPWGLKAVPGGDQRKADIGCLYKYVCIDKRGARYVYSGRSTRPQGT